MGLQAYSTPDRSDAIDWKECEDIRVLDDDGHVIYSGPRWMRCARAECGGLVTHGMIRNGGCPCGRMRVVAAWKLSATEKAMLKRGHYPLLDWEYKAIHGNYENHV